MKTGDRIGDWVVDEPLGEGGMGAVYRAHSALSGRVEAALKVMKPSMDATSRARFVREAEALAALRHPAIVRVMAVNEDPHRGLYLVMELALGETLKARLARGPLPLAEALDIFVPLASALEHSHAAGVYHRDLKPANVILCRDGSVRLVDFGIASVPEANTLTAEGHVGTLSYLPPELFRGEAVVPAHVDAYAFGLLLHEALTGVHPFPMEPNLTPAAAVAHVGMRKLQHPAMDPGAAFADGLRALIRGATSPDPAQRPTLRAVLDELVALRDTLPRPAGGNTRAWTPRTPTPVPPLPAPAWIPAPAAEPPLIERTTRVPDPEVSLMERGRAFAGRAWRERPLLLGSAALGLALAALVAGGVAQGRATPDEPELGKRKPQPVAAATGAATGALPIAPVGRESRVASPPVLPPATLPPAPPATAVAQPAGDDPLRPASVALRRGPSDAQDADPVPHPASPSPRPEREPSPSPRPAASPRAAASPSPTPTPTPSPAPKPASQPAAATAAPAMRPSASPLTGVARPLNSTAVRPQAAAPEQPVARRAKPAAKVAEPAGEEGGEERPSAEPEPTPPPMD